MDTPNVLGTPDLPVRTFGAAHTAHALSPNLSAKRIGVQPSRVGHDPACGFLTAGGILSRLDRWLPLCVSDAGRENERPPENPQRTVLIILVIVSSVYSQNRVPKR